MPTPVHGGHYSEPRVAKRLVKGLIDFMSAQGNILAVGTIDGVYIYDIKNKAEINYFSYPYSVSDIDLIQNGQYLLINFYTTYFNEDGIERIKTQGLSLRDIKTGDLLWEFVAPGKINDLELSPDGKMIAISCVNYDHINRIHFLDVKTGHEDVSKRIETGEYGWINYAPDDNQLIFSGQKIMVINSKTYEVIGENPNGLPHSRESFLSSDGNYLVLVTRESIDYLPKFTTWVYRKNQEGNYLFYYSFLSKQGLGTEILGFIPESNHFVVKQYDNNEVSIRKIYDLDDNGKALGTIDTRCDSYELFHKLPNDEIGLVCVADGELMIHYATQDSIDIIAKGFINPDEMFYLEDGAVLASTSWLDSNLYLWDINSGDLINRIDLNRELGDLKTSWSDWSVSQNGRILAAQNRAQGSNHEMGFWDLDTGELITTKLYSPPPAGDIVFSPYDETVFFADSGYQLISANIENDEITTLYTNYQCKFSYSGLVLSKINNDIIYAGLRCDDQSIVSAINMKEKTTTDYIIPASYLTRFVVSKDESLLVASYFNGHDFDLGLIALDLIKNEMIFNIELRDQAQAIAISPDNQLVAVGFDYQSSINRSQPGNPKTTTLFDATNGREIVSFGTEKSSRGNVSSLLFTPDGEIIVTKTSFIDFWDVSLLLK